MRILQKLNFSPSTHYYGMGDDLHCSDEVQKANLPGMKTNFSNACCAGNVKDSRDSILHSTSLVILLLDSATAVAIAENQYPLESQRRVVSTKISIMDARSQSKFVMNTSTMPIVLLYSLLAETLESKTPPCQYYLTNKTP